VNNKSDLETMHEATCMDISIYREALTRGKKYEVLAYDEAKGKIRVKGDNGRTRWFPKLCFDLKGRTVGVLESFTIDDPILDPKMDCIEVTVKLSTRRKRWCFFVTPSWLEAYMSGTLEPKPIDHDGWVIHQITYLGHTVTTREGRQFEAIHVPHMIIVPELTPEIIEASLRYIDGQGELKECTKSLR
jgi:hypothetical protein